MSKSQGKDEYSNPIPDRRGSGITGKGMRIGEVVLAITQKGSKHKKENITQHVSKTQKYILVITLTVAKHKKN